MIVPNAVIRSIEVMIGRRVCTRLCDQAAIQKKIRDYLKLSPTFSSYDAIVTSRTRLTNLILALRCGQTVDHMKFF